jgi:hypothetical protein
LLNSIIHPLIRSLSFPAKKGKGLALDTNSLRNENGQKYARLGNSSMKSLIAIGAIIFFLLYVTSIGVSAANQSSIASTTTKAVTKTTTVYRSTTTKRVTTTVTETPTATPNVFSGYENLNPSASETYILFTHSVDCSTTVTIQTLGFYGNSGDADLTLQVFNGGGYTIDTPLVAGYTTDSPGTTFTASGAQLKLVFSTGSASSPLIYIDVSWTAVCPS